MSTVVAAAANERYMYSEGGGKKRESGEKEITWDEYIIDVNKPFVHFNK